MSQARFLSQELSSRIYRKAKRRILVHHIPLWFERTGDKGAVSEPCRELWLPTLRKANFDISLNAHVHEYRLLEANKLDTPYPVLTGGGPSLGTATMTVIRKHGKKLTCTTINAEGKTISEINL